MCTGKPSTLKYLARLTLLVATTLVTACENLSPNSGTVEAASSLGASRTIVGLSVFLPQQNLSEPIAEGRGKQLFADLQNCVVEDPLAGDSQGYVHIWTNSSEFYHYLQSDTQLDAAQNNAYSMKATLNAVYSGSTDEKVQFAGAVYDFRAFKETFSLRDACEQGSRAKPLDPDLLAAFNALPYPVPSPDQESSWRPYQKFLEIYGSHYVRQVQSGARFRSFTFKNSYDRISESELKIAACIQVDNNISDSGASSVKGCENIDKKQRESIKTSDYTSTTSAYGGNETVRNQLTAGDPVTPALLAKFADTADILQDGVQYQLVPIWKLLSLRATNTLQENQAISLQAYFEGFLTSNCQQIGGCGCTKIVDNKGKVTLRHFVQTDTQFAKYACQVPVMGCRNNDDCHYNGAKAYCQCYGDHCINVSKRDGKVLSMGVNYSNRITGKNTGPNKSCSLGKNLQCNCTRPDPNAMWHTNWSI